MSSGVGQIAAEGGFWLVGWGERGLLAPEIERRSLGESRQRSPPPAPELSERLGFFRPFQPISPH